LEHPEIVQIASQTTAYANYIAISGDNVSTGIFRKAYHTVRQGNPEMITQIQALNPGFVYQKPEEKPFVLAIANIEEMEINPKMLIPKKTGKLVDDFFSYRKGLMPGTQIMLYGGPGSGKSTLALHIERDALDNARGQRAEYKEKIYAEYKIANPEMKEEDYPEIPEEDYPIKLPKIGMIQGEMKFLDLIETLGKGVKDLFEGIDVLFLADYVKDRQVKQALEAFIDQEYDIIIMDSFKNIRKKLMGETGWSGQQTEAWMVENITSLSEKHGTVMIVIQQVNKDGSHNGSNDTQHEFTTTAHVVIEKGTRRRYAEAVKNRRGPEYRKLFFILDENNKMEYDQVAWDLEEEGEKFESDLNKSIKESTLNFDEQMRLMKQNAGILVPSGRENEDEENED
jgi:RecA/RadA recombinase